MPKSQCWKRMGTKNTEQTSKRANEQRIIQICMHTENQSIPVEHIRLGTFQNEWYQLTYNNGLNSKRKRNCLLHSGGILFHWIFIRHENGKCAHMHMPKWMCLYVSWYEILCSMSIHRCANTFTTTTTIYSPTFRYKIRISAVLYHRIL